MKKRKRRQDENLRKARNEKAEKLYNEILKKEKSVGERIKSILHAYHKQEELKVQPKSSWAQIVFNFVPDSLKDKKSEWLSFVSIYLSKRKAYKNRLEEESSFKKETRDMLNNRSYGEQLEISFG